MFADLGRPFRRLASCRRGRALAAVGSALLAAGLAGCTLPGSPGWPTSGAPGSGMGTEVVVKRDAWGMPHVYADSVYALFYGYGHAVAQDRLFQMEMARRSTQGRVAEVLGEKFVAFDRSIRANFWPQSIRDQIDRLPAADRDILEGYAAGMNAWLDAVRRQPDRLMPRQFADFGFQPEPWTAYDVAMVFVGTMANRFSDANTEIDNLALLTALKDRHGAVRGQQAFDQLKWVIDLQAPTTVAPEDGRYAVPLDQSARLSYALPRYDGEPPALARLAKTADGSLMHGGPDAHKRQLLAQLESGGMTGQAGFPSASNIWIVGAQRSRGASAILVNGPQFGWFSPAYTYGIGLHGAGFDVSGNTPFAYPCVLFGHNGTIAWGSTAGFGDGVDIFVEKLDAADPTRYWHRGRWLRMEERVETIQVKGAAAVRFEVYRTVHGLVVTVDPAQGVAYAKARTWEGRELESLMGWVRQGQATDWKGWLAQAERNALTINWYYADVRGNIGYAHTGKYPRRRAGHDRRLPVPGTGEMDWEGLLPFATNPQVYNPRRGYIANWNNSPIRGYPNPDPLFLSWGRADRLHEIEERLASTPTIDAEGMWALLKPTSLADVNRRYFLPVLEKAVATLAAGDARRALVDGLRGWDGLASDEDRDGFYDHPGPAVMDAWLQAMLRLTLADDVPGDLSRFFLATGYPTAAAPPVGSINVQPGVKVLYQALLGGQASVPQRFDFFNGHDPLEVTREALGAASQALQRAYGAEPARWRVPVARNRFQASNFFGVPQAGEAEVAQTHVAMNRGTENNLSVLRADGISAWDVVAPGQSGFVAPDGRRDQHHADQLDPYDRFSRKPVWHAVQDVDRNAASVERLVAAPR